MTQSWHIAGEYLECCNCEFLCPCLLGPRNPRGGPMAEPTEGHCDVPLVFRIDRGAYGDVDLGGTHAALAIYTPGPMGEGGWTTALYIDAAAAPDQHEALDAIFAGRAGGNLAGVRAATVEWLPTKTVAITFEADGLRRRAAIPEIMDIEIEGIAGADGGVTWLDNVRHFVSRRLAAAKTLRGSYGGHEEPWDNSGGNAHYASFDWSGP